ncbi:MAG TPA: phycobiliprotein lyase [Cyanobacteria bacterium UBA12227]|nr:phycobiliprotein lyase [Cyanobacteria bacterium UBA12227]HAX85891.1 phycobiliprotein lyase [Cyanobacteria bacterium UBA11370]HBY81026.1 phycobiliprotein lyase [Cyanobacteria bacterium UBA11148]
MDIKEFFEQSAGRWFSQRSSHHLPFKQPENGKSNVTIELLVADAPEVLKLCQQYKIDPSLAVCGAKITWDGTLDSDQQKQQGSTVLVPIADSDQLNEGRLLREIKYAEKAPVIGRYSLGNDGVLTLISEDETLYSEERLWFASPNLRMRTSIFKHLGGFSMASLSSEIRMGVTAPAKKSEDEAKV